MTAPAGRIVVVAGKGGVGKTSLTALLVKLLRHRKLLVIDADPVISLTHVLGAPVHDSLGDLREELIVQPRRARGLDRRPTREVIAELVSRRGDGYDLLIMGRTERSGCFCGVNELLRHGVQSLCGGYDLTLIDSEAGIEQVNRRAVDRIDHLVVVTDASRRGFEAIVQVRALATRYNENRPLATHVVVNRVRDADERAAVDELARLHELPDVLAIPEDPLLRAANLQGTSLLDLSERASAVLAMRALSDDLAGAAGDAVTQRQR